MVINLFHVSTLTHTNESQRLAYYFIGRDYDTLKIYLKGMIGLSNGTCRDELLSAARSIVKSKGRNELTLKEVFEYMQSNNTTYKKSTIRTHLCSRCCINSNRHHAIVYNDYERIGVGCYKVINL